MADNNNAPTTEVTVRIDLADGTAATSDQTVACRLYLHDRRLGCGPPAALCAEGTCTIAAGESGSTITFLPDMGVTHAGMRWDEMLGPELYLALDVAESTVTYESSPLFGIKPGDDDLVLKVKEKTDAIGA